jgi:glutathione S-transferase
MLDQNPAFLWPSIVTVASLLVYFVLTLNVGRARYKYGVKPPEMTGNPDFERVVRVQQNTVEQIVLFLPSLWLFSLLISPVWAGGIGAFWIVGRILFAWGYYQAAEKRGPGFGITLLSTLSLMIGSLVGVILPLVKQLN